MTVTRRNRVIVVPIPHQRQGGDAGGDLVTGVIGRRRQRHERRYVRLHAFADRDGMATQDRLAPFDAGVEKAGVERLEAIGDG